MFQQFTESTFSSLCESTHFAHKIAQWEFQQFAESAPHHIFHQCTHENCLCHGHCSAHPLTCWLFSFDKIWQWVHTSKHEFSSACGWSGWHVLQSEIQSKTAHKISTNFCLVDWTHSLALCDHATHKTFSNVPKNKFCFESMRIQAFNSGVP